MRVCHVISGIDSDNGGPPLALAGLAAAQVRAGMQVSVLSSYRFPEKSVVDAEKMKKNGVEVRLIGPAKEPMSRHPMLAPAAREMCKSHDVLHIHSMWESIQYHATSQARKLGTPYVMTPHGMLDSWNIKKKVYYALRMRSNVRSAAAIHLATQIEREHVEKLGLGVRTIVEPHGLNLSEFRTLPEKGAFREKFPQLRDKPYVVFLGRLDKGKGLELLVPALAKMKRSDAMLVLVGPDFGMRAPSEAVAQRDGTANRILFTGMLLGPDKVAALSDATVFSLPSYHENFGIAVAESLAAGTPVVVSDQVYLHPLITQEKLGGVVPLDAGALARELDRWIADATLRQQVSTLARPYALNHFDWDTIAHHWLDHYKGLKRS
ncbi:MAG TPA: glycosyltransferase [Tepidisphaeraceae bacterium]|jgi:glycosyltransferase involved in cell wall biosynthesis